VVLDALTKMPPEVRQQLHVIFVGAIAEPDRAYKQALDDIVQKAELAATVTFLGGRSDVPDLLNAADIALHASIKPEPFGLVVTEAMALGKPVVAANRGGPAEILTPESGITFDAASPEQLASALVQLALDPGLRRRMATAARVRVEGFTIERNVRKTQDVYDALLHR
jgi:glycosyltransferase involved in cell wall biosynthesis